MHIETPDYVDSSHTEAISCSFVFIVFTLSLVFLNPLTLLFVYPNFKNVNMLKGRIILCFLSMLRKWTACFQNGKIDTSVG